MPGPFFPPPVSARKMRPEAVAETRWPARIQARAGWRSIYCNLSDGLAAEILTPMLAVQARFLKFTTAEKDLPMK